MKIKIIKSIAVVLCAVIFMMVLKSCKKIGEEDNTTNQKTKEEIIADFKLKNPNVGAETITRINQKFSYSYYGDKKGIERMVGIKGNEKKSGLNNTSEFTHCSSGFCPDPLDSYQLYDPEQELYSMGRYYFCSTGTSDISFTWDISVPNTIVAANPLNSAQKSVGKVWLKSSTNVIITSNPAIIPTITLVGTDPNCAAHNIYRVVYTLKGVPQEEFSNNPGYKLVTQVLLFYGCNDYIQYYLSPVSTYATSSTYGGVDVDGSGSILGPCLRNDRCYTNGPSPTYATVIGGYTFCTYTPAYPTDLQRYEYRKKTSLTSDDWANQSGTIYWGDDPSTLTPTHDFSPYIGFLQLTNMTVGSGTWIVRYQNVMTTPCSPSAPWREEVYTF